MFTVYAVKTWWLVARRDPGSNERQIPCGTAAWLQGTGWPRCCQSMSKSCLILLGLEAHNMYAILYWVPFWTSTHVSCCSFFKHWNRTIPPGDAWSFFPMPTKVGPCVGWHEMCCSGLASVASCWFVGGTQCLDGWTLLLISDDFQFVS